MVKNIYKPTNEEVGIGDIIETMEGFNLTFSLNLLDNNSHMFEIVNNDEIK